MIITVPQDAALYPTLGPQVCDFIEQNMVYGPGDLRGQPVRLDEEKRGLIWRMYEVFPKGHRRAGRRRFRRCAISLPKGLGKTELAAWIAACELHPEAPVRCTGFTRGGEPIGGPVTDPYIPFVAFSEEQSAENAFAALRAILEEGPLRDDFDIGIERVLRKKGDGKAVSLSANPNARDGARTTFSVEDETHRFVLLRHKQAHQTMQANLGKRFGSDPWGFEITTAPEPGTGSVAEATMEYAAAVASGKVADAALLFFHRQASDDHDLTTDAGARAAVIEASGTAVGWRDLDGIMAMWHDPTVDRAYWERVWCNRLVQSSSQAFSVPRWKELALPNYEPAPNAQIVIGFDGSQFHDATGVICTEIETGVQWKAGAWECPPLQQEWQVPVAEVDAVIRDLFARFRVWRMYADPPYWQSWVAQWKADYKTEDAKDRVVEWWTNRRRPMTAALEGFTTAIREGILHHDDDPDVRRHIGNSRRENIPGWRDEQGKPAWLIRKDRADSPHKIDLAMASVLSWEARTDAIAAGVLTAQEPGYQMLFMGGR